MGPPGRPLRRIAGPWFSRRTFPALVAMAIAAAVTVVAWIRAPGWWWILLPLPGWALLVLLLRRGSDHFELADAWIRFPASDPRVPFLLIWAAGRDMDVEGGRVVRASDIRSWEVRGPDVTLVLAGGERVPLPLGGLRPADREEVVRWLEGRSPR